jgi:alpha,alpha-trehalose phosphorylase
MLKREVIAPPEHLYPPDEWRIVEARFTPENFGRAETIFALANGYLGVRGAFDEGRPALAPATFVNGFHETWPIVHPEEAYGLARTGQTMVAVPDAAVLQLYVDDEPLFLPVARTQRYSRALDMRNGTLTRDVVWSTPAGKHVGIRSSRLVSFEHRHLLAVSYELTLLDHPASLAVSSRVSNRQDLPGDGGRDPVGLDPRFARRFSHRVLHRRMREVAGDRLLLGYETANSHMTLAVGVDHVVENVGYEATVESDEDTENLVIVLDARVGEPLRIVKYVAYQTSRSAPVGELAGRCRRTLARAVGGGFEALAAGQREQLDHFWDRADVGVRAYGDERDVRLQQAVRWNLFQLAQASWRAEGSSIPAKGLTGQAYEGHYFWDTEVYVLPFLAYTRPRIARNLLRFRHSMLDRAKARAATVSQEGALFPWRTINGDEASANFQAGTAQYHINGDIAYAIRKYVDVRGDIDLLVEVGAEMLVETARLWADLGFYGGDGCFHIHGVTGPDEYTTVVNDNTYTNLVARLNLNEAVGALRRLQREQPAGYAAVAHSCRLRDGEIEVWERAARAMYVPYSAGRGIHPQDEGFLGREPWDLASTPSDKFPLLLHFHPLVIYRFQVVKQADVVLAMYLHGNEFSSDQKRRNFEYYDPITTGDSSLSAAVESIVAAEIGEDDKALEYFRYALLMDLADVAGNASDGVHVATAGGVWMALVFGFGGVRDFDGRLTFEPKLPRTWTSLAFSLRFHNRQLRVALRHDEERYLLEEGEPIEVEIRRKAVRLQPGVAEVMTR